MLARREWERDDHARSASSVLRVLSRAAQPMQRRLDGTKLSDKCSIDTTDACSLCPPAPMFEPLRNTPSTKGTWTFGCRPTHEGEIHCCLCSECRSAGRHCFAWHSRDVRDAGGSLVSREHERVCRRVTGQCPTTGQRLFDAVTGDQRSDSHLDTNIDVRAPVSLVFLGGRLVQLHLQAEHRKGHAMAPYRECGMAGRRTVECHSLSDRSAHLCRARVRSNG